MNCYLNIGVEGHASWPTEETTIQFGGQELILRPATRETEQSVHINLKGINANDGLTLINRFLSILSWCDDKGMVNLYGWSGNSVPCSIPRKSRHIGSSIAFPFRRGPSQDSKVNLALALYREGLSVNSTAFQFLSFFKVLNIFWRDKYDSGKNEIIEGTREYLPKLTDVMAKKRVAQISNDEPDPAKYLYKSGRCAIAHAYADPIVDPDDIEHLQRLSADLCVVKGVAEMLIAEKLHVPRCIYKDF